MVIPQSQSIASPGSAIEEDSPSDDARPDDRGGWTITVLCIGLAVVAACLIFPQADANRRLNYQLDALRLDLAQLQKQSAVNREFLGRIDVDAQLVERLAQRQMKMYPQGEAALNLSEMTSQDGGGANTLAAAAQRVSPFSILRVPPPPKPLAYQPLGGPLAAVCLAPRSELYLLGAGMFLVAVGLMLGGSKAAN